MKGRVLLCGGIDFFMCGCLFAGKSSRKKLDIPPLCPIFVAQYAYCARGAFVHGMYVPIPLS